MGSSGWSGSDAPACLCLGKHRIVIAQSSLPGVPLPWVTESGGTVCSPLKALFSQWIPDFLGAVAGLWAVLRVLRGHFCSPGPGGFSPSWQAVGPPGGGSRAGMTGAVCDPLAAVFLQWVLGPPGAVAGLWAVLWDLGVRYCSPGPGGTSTSGQAVGPPGGGSCAGSEVSARLFPNSQTIGNLGIAIPKVNSRQLAGIPGIQRNPSCARGSRFVRPPLGLQFPRGKRNPEGGGLRYAHARSAAGSVGPAWPFLPLPEIFSALCVQVAHGQ